MIGTEIDLLKNYPRTKRNTNSRAHKKTEKSRNIAQCFGKEFFDGERDYGYGGYYYNPKYWEQVVSDIVNYYELKSSSSVLDIGCAKGFMLNDLVEAVPGIEVSGLDISKYAIDNCIDTMKPYLQVADAVKLPFEDNSFDLVISITTLHNLKKDKFVHAIQEIERVRKKNSYITLDAYRNEEERIAMEQWNLTAETFMAVEQWKEFLNSIGYSGDYYWFFP